ncbi:hypothetical protein UAJ10_16450 [Nitrospirillum sp. BR 11164]|uniref:hypothetical protein n=1 Tax=Nitrospirillum sp. BR 11164 TaxID=3104324 RepID=UPI002AFDE7C2|nr:hypothetical protein [Nitrospirillum sp. BR 11164]MEA1650598.1 hypothetical protein [Nitrospirillum sp. BR 11164]
MTDKSDKGLPGKGTRVVEIIELPNKLRAKVGGAAGKPGQIDPAAIDRASRHVARMAEAHQTQTRIDLTTLQAAFEQAKRDTEHRAQHLRKVYKISDGIMTLGRTFGYNLLSDFANSMNHFLVDLENPTDALLTVVGLHIDAMHVVVRDDIKGDGGELGQALTKSLALARAKLIHKR